MRRVLIWASTAIVILGAATFVGVTVHRRILYGHEYGESGLAVRIGRYDRLSVKVQDLGASVGDHWTARADPEGVLTAKGDALRGSPFEGLGPLRAGCCERTHLFTFDAVRAGTAAITVSNCFRGCDTPDNRAYSRAVVWTVTVG